MEAYEIEHRYVKAPKPYLKDIDYITGFPMSRIGVSPKNEIQITYKDGLDLCDLDKILFRCRTAKNRLSRDSLFTFFPFIFDGDVEITKDWSDAKLVEFLWMLYVHVYDYKTNKGIISNILSENKDRSLATILSEIFGRRF